MLTIAIPVFERKDYFEEALNSAINQSEVVNIIVVDNASSHTFFRDTIDKLGLNNIKYYRNSKNLGMYENWNKCVELCKTEFVMILGDDDIIMPYYAAKLGSVLKKYPEIDLFHGAMHRFGPDYNEPQQAINFLIGRHTGEEMLLNCIKFGPNISTNAMAFRCIIHRQFRFLYPEFAYNQDWLFVYTAFSNSVCYGVVDILLHLRINPSGNAVLIGERATLSLTMVYREIEQALRLKYPYWANIARRKAKFVVRNCIIKGKIAVIKEMICNDVNPFGKQIKEILNHDLLSRIALHDETCFYRLIVFYFRVERALFTKLELL